MPLDYYTQAEYDREKANLDRLKSLMAELRKKPREEWTDQDHILETAFFMQNSEFDRKSRWIR